MLALYRFNQHWLNRFSKKLVLHFFNLNYLSSSELFQNFILISKFLKDKPHLGLHAFTYFNDKTKPIKTWLYFKDPKVIIFYKNGAIKMFSPPDSLNSILKLIFTEFSINVFIFILLIEYMKIGQDPKFLIR